MILVRRWAPLVVAAGVVATACSSGADGDAVSAPPAERTTGAQTTTATARPLCDFRPAASAAREVAPPETDPAVAGLVTIDLLTTAGQIPMVLDRAGAPCNVESLVSLAEQGYFDDTECHRLTTQGIYVLQCGDPTGTGTGGPGYTVPDEFPKDLPEFVGPDGPVTGATVYPRGSIAIANTGQRNTGGSQFFLVYADSPLPPAYSLVGAMDEVGLATVDAIAERGAESSPHDPEGVDGAPVEPVVITETVVAVPDV